MGEVLKRRIIARGKHLMLACSEDWEYVERLYSNGVVVVAATTDENELILTEQYRVPLHANVIELPAGLVGDCKETEHEDVFEAAKRELLEESGYLAEHFSLIISGPSSAGLSSEIYTIVHARGLKKTGPGGGVD